MRSLNLISPAKLNLFLEVVHKRSDGFHNIRTIFQRIDLCDTIHLKENKDGDIRITCDQPDVPTDSRNLVYRATELMRQKAKIRKGVDIDIRKKIPVAAGLAGGSSNAATVLNGLNKLWGLGFSRQKLLPLAKEIGSDVAFFIYDTSWALGVERGDKIQPIPSPLKLWFVVVTPCVKLYAQKVYQGLKIKLTKTGDDVNILVRNLKKGNTLGISRNLRNDLETEVFRLCPKLLKLKQRLSFLEAQGVLVSGSGPSVFGLMPDEESARRAQKFLKKNYSRVFVVGTL